MKFKKAVVIFVALVAIAFIGFWAYVQIRTYQAEPDYMELIMADRSIVIEEERNYYKITPVDPDLALKPIIYYPGGLVAPEAYLYKMGTVASNLNKDVYIIKAPLNAAIFNTGAAGEIIDNNGLDEVWVGGHSLGGIAACRYASANADKVYGLFLFGSYCDQDISGFTGPVVSIMGLRDLIINRDNYSAAKTELPETSAIYEIEGLNHSDFGNYGLQQGDGESNLSNKQVIEIISSVFIE